MINDKNQSIKSGDQSENRVAGRDYNDNSTIVINNNHNYYLPPKPDEEEVKNYAHNNEESRQASQSEYVADQSSDLLSMPAPPLNLSFRVPDADIEKKQSPEAQLNRAVVDWLYKRESGYLADVPPTKHGLLSFIAYQKAGNKGLFYQIIAPTTPQSMIRKSRSELDYITESYNMSGIKNIHLIYAAKDESDALDLRKNINHTDLKKTYNLNEIIIGFIYRTNNEGRLSFTELQLDIEI